MFNFNPMYPLTDDYKVHAGWETVEWAQINAAAMIPEPRGGGGDNLVFLQGARRMNVIIAEWDRRTNAADLKQ